MKKILEDLYFGDLQLNVWDDEKNLTLQKNVQMVDKNENILLKVLEGKERQLFLDLIDAQSEIEGNCAVNNFINGFKIGAKIMIETFVKT